MKKPAKIVVHNGPVAEAQTYEAPGTGAISRIVGGVRRLLMARPRRLSEGAADPGRERETRRGARHSAMDAGITGGFTLLGGTDRRERR